MMYEDDEIFSAAFRLLNQQFEQRKNLRKNLSQVYLLDTPQIPVFQNVYQLKGDCDQLGYMLRSYSKWGLNSPSLRVSIDHVVVGKIDAIVQKLVQLLSTLPSAPGSDGKGTEMVALTTEETKNSEPQLEVNTHFQNVLREVGFGQRIVEAMKIDYNLCFKGAKCTLKDKFESQRILLQTVEKVLGAAERFVYHNASNQELIIASLAPLSKLCHAELITATDKEVADANIQKSDLNKADTVQGLAKKIIIELCRGDEKAAKLVPQSVYEMFGDFVNGSDDPSSCPDLEIFSLLASPRPGHPIRKHQNLALDQVLRYDLDSLKFAVQESMFFSTATSNVRDPLRVVRLLRCLAQEGNLNCFLRSSHDVGITQKTLMIELKYLLPFVAREPPPDDAIAQQATERLQDLEKQNGAAYVMDLAGSMAGYLADMVEAMPVDTEVLTIDLSFWEFLKHGANPLLTAFSRQSSSVTRDGYDWYDEPHAGGKQAKVPASFVSFLFCIVSSFMKAAAAADLFEDIKEQKTKRRLLRSVADRAQEVLEAALPALKKHEYHGPAEEAVRTTRVSRLSFEDEEIEYGADFDVGLYDLAENARQASISYGNPDIELPEIESDDESDEEESSEIYGRERSEYGINFANFNDILQENPLIEEAIKARKYSLLEILEQGLAGFGNDTEGDESALGLGMAADLAADMALKTAGMAVKQVSWLMKSSTSDDTGFEKGGACAISWKDLVTRMVEYCSSHYFNDDDETLLRIMSTLRMHLLKARTEHVAEGPLDFNEMDAEEREDKKHILKALHVKQAVLQECGLCTQVFNILTHAQPDVHEGSLAEEAFQVASEMLVGVSPSVQEAFALGMEEDTENRFLLHLMARIEMTHAAIAEHRAHHHHHLSHETRDQVVSGINTMAFLQSLCEGHFLQMQNLLREQPTHQANANIVKSTVELFIFICADSTSVQRLSSLEADLVEAIMLFLIEVMQGPCPENQLFITKSEAIVAIKYILPNSVSAEGSEEENVAKTLQLHATAVLLLKTCLEGRKDRECHEIIATRIEVILLQEHQLLHEEQAHDLRVKRFLSDEEADILDKALDSVVNVTTIKDELDKMPEYHLQIEAHKNDNEEIDQETAHYISTIEIWWRGQIERVSFPLPRASPYLSEDAKNKFLSSVDLSTTERRNKALLRECGVLIGDMRNVHLLASRNMWYRVVNRNINEIKQTLYFIVVLVNLSVLMSPDELRQPYKLLFDCSDDQTNARGYCTVPDRLQWPLRGLVVLAVINFLGYFLVVFYLCNTEIPILVKRQVSSAAAKMNDPNVDPSEYRDWGAFSSIIVYATVSFVFCFLHGANYEPNYSLYWLIWSFFFFWMVKCFRDFVVVPSNPILLGLVCIYDIIFRRPFLRNHLVLQVVAFFGFQNTEYFSLMLLDIFSVSPLLQDIIRSFTVPLPKLGLVLFVTLATTFIFVSFGFQSFYGRESDDENGGSQWRAQDDENEIQCTTITQCYLYILYYGLPGGDISGLMSQLDIDDSLLWRRMLFDLAFFLWIGIIMMSIITGLILDTFASLREEADARAEILSSTCFICGIVSNRTT